MKLAVVSDIHGNLPALEAVVWSAEAAGCTHFVNLGDSLSGPLWPAETADYLMARNWTTIRGNHERQLLTLPKERMNLSDRHTIGVLSDSHLEWLGQQPETLELENGIFLCHGSPRRDVEYFLEHVDQEGVRQATEAEVVERSGGRTERLILCGHTHLPRLVRLPDGRTIANPGSAGLPAYADDLPVPHVMESGSPSVRYAHVDQGEIEFVEVAYDHESAARRAEQNGRLDWAVALRTGRMA
ncbi:MAG TPA: metallophosphoesterase family protein [Allosphingosinicella sp.]|uniref:metallophosphoesterase family protein n=1 Tax=Allosphingosinicella sp. TaxID=2823234 RepID=UPI002ED94B6D